MELLEFVFIIAVFILFFGWGYLYGREDRSKKRLPQSILDKKCGIVLDYNHNTRGAIIFQGMEPKYGIQRKGGDYGTIILTKEGGATTTLTVEEAYQLGRALQYTSWREDFV